MIKRGKYMYLQKRRVGEREVNAFILERRTFREA